MREESEGEGREEGRKGGKEDEVWEEGRKECIYMRAYILLKPTAKSE